MSNMYVVTKIEKSGENCKFSPYCGFRGFFINEGFIENDFENAIKFNTETDARLFSVALTGDQYFNFPNEEIGVVKVNENNEIVDGTYFSTSYWFNISNKLRDEQIRERICHSLTTTAYKENVSDETVAKLYNALLDFLHVEKEVGK